jgi:putative serine protease PepD
MSDTTFTRPQYPDPKPEASTWPVNERYEYGQRAASGSVPPPSGTLPPPPSTLPPPPSTLPPPPSTLPPPSGTLPPPSGTLPPPSGWTPLGLPTPPGTIPPAGDPAPAGSRPPRGRKALIAAAVAAVVLAGGATGGGIAAALANGAPTTSTTSLTAAPVANANTVLPAVVKAVSPDVVTVFAQAGRGTSEGSGMILSSDGMVVTNNHVIQSVAGGSGTITVQLSDGAKKTATLVGANAQADIAVLKIQGASGLTPAKLGDSSMVQVGDTVLAFGSPLGLQGTVTSGIISALNRDATTSAGGSGGRFGQVSQNSMTGLLQTDAAINSGNSGGPLVDTAGRVIGIDVAIATSGSSTGNIGVGFAIPINTVKTVVNQILSQNH